MHHPIKCGWVFIRGGSWRESGKDRKGSALRKCIDEGPGSGAPPKKEGSVFYFYVFPRWKQDCCSGIENVAENHGVEQTAPPKSVRAPFEINTAVQYLPPVDQSVFLAPVFLLEHIQDELDGVRFDGFVLNDKKAFCWTHFMMNGFMAACLCCSPCL